MTEMLFSTSLVAIVVAPRQLHIKNTKVGLSSRKNIQTDVVQRQSTICELTFPAAILAVRMNRLRLVVVLEDLIYVYDMSTMKILHTLETSPNPNGKGCFSKKMEATDPFSNLCSIFVLGELLSSFSTSTKGSHTSISAASACSSRR